MMAAQNTRRPTGYHSTSPADPLVDDGRAKQRQIAEPPGRQADAEQEGEEEIEAEREPKAGRREERGHRPAQWLQPMAAIRIGSGAR